MDLVKTKDRPGSDKKIFGPAPGPTKKNVQTRAGPEPGRACLLLPNSDAKRGLDVSSSRTASEHLPEYPEGV